VFVADLLRRKTSMRLRIAFFGALLFGALLFGSATASAAIAFIPIGECRNCTAAQMQTMAKNKMPPGLGFVYDLPAHKIRKYEIYWDSSCVQPDGNGGDASAAPAEANAADACGSFKAADEMTPVDAKVQTIFDTVYHIWQVNPNLLASPKAVKQGPLPYDADTGHNFDPRDVAWEYPQGAYLRFMNYVNNALETQAGANALLPGLGDVLYGWVIAGFDLGALIGGAPGFSFTLKWDIGAPAKLEWCVPPALDCVELDLTPTPGGKVQVAFLGVVDMNTQIYPSESGKTPGDLGSWHFRNGGADHFADGMRHGGVYVPSAPNCGYGAHDFLQITRLGTQIIDVNWSCIQN
jgi:hypothetical protein